MRFNRSLFAAFCLGLSQAFVAIHALADSPLRSSGSQSFFADGRDPVHAMDPGSNYFGVGSANEIRLTVAPITMEGYTAADRGFVVPDQDSVSCTDTCTLLAQVHLPTGALVTAVLATLNDDDAAGKVEVTFEQCSFYLLGCGLGPVVEIDTGELDTPGAGLYFAVEPNGGHTVDNFGNHYLLVVELTGGTTNTAILATQLVWQRQISPAPDTATFGDVPTDHPFFQGVEALVAAGITSGCGPGSYCPDNPVTRGQMALFLARALGLHYSDVPPPVVTP